MKLKLHFDADGLQQVHEECSSYSSVITEQAVALKKRHEEKVRQLKCICNFCDGSFSLASDREEGDKRNS